MISRGILSIYRLRFSRLKIRFSFFMVSCDERSIIADTFKLINRRAIYFNRARYHDHVIVSVLTGTKIAEDRYLEPIEQSVIKNHEECKGKSGRHL